MRAVDVFGVLGASLVMYAVGRVLMNLSLRREDSGRDDFWCAAFVYSSVLFLFFGMIAACIVHVVNSYPNDRMCKFARDEERDSMKSICDAEVRSAVLKEHDRLSAYYTSLMREQSDKIRSEESERYRDRLREIIGKREAGREL